MAARTWAETRHGALARYQHPVAMAAQQAQAKRGRAPTRGERKVVEGPAATLAAPSAGCGPIHHSCWTYWGHSGAPLFNAVGDVVGLHAAWDDGNGMRHGQTLQHIHAGIRLAVMPATSGAPRISRKRVRTK